jgi:hypothetical protein
MASPQSPERTAFTLDVQGRYICNGLDEAIDVNTGNALGGRPLRHHYRRRWDIRVSLRATSLLR